MFDHYIVSSLVEEIEENLLNYRLQKIWSIDQTSFLFKFRSQAFFYIDLSAQNSHGRILQSKAPTQDLPQPFLLALRKTLEGAKLIGVSQVKEDRTICLSFQGKNITYDRVIYKLYLEFMGRHSNAIITQEDNKILYAYKTTPFEADTQHIVRPSWIYSPLSPRKKSPLGSSEVSDRLLDYNGFYKKLIKLLPQNVLLMKVGEIHNWISESRDFTIFLDQEGSIEDFHQFKNKGPRSLSFPNLSTMLAVYYGRERNKGKKTARIKKILSNRLELVEVKIAKLESKLLELEEAGKFKLWGELILAYLHQLEKGDKTPELVNYYDNSLVEIPLDSNKSPLENSQIYYKKYEKLRRSEPEILKQLEEAKGEKLVLDQLLYELSQIDTPQELDEVIQEMEGLKLIQKTKRTSIKPSMARVFSYLGYRFEVGKNNRQNDEIRRKVKNNKFVWFHTKNLPGSHVILHEELERVPGEVLNFGAKLAAYYSKAQGHGVTVDYTTLSKLTRPRGAAPGFVNYSDAKQIYTGAQAEEILPFEVK